MNEIKKNLLVDFDADGALSDIPDPTGTTMVELVRHALMNGAVHLDVDIISDLVGAKVGSQGDVPLLPEGTGEEISCAGTKTMTSRHPLALRRRAEWQMKLGFPMRRNL